MDESSDPYDARQVLKDRIRSVCYGAQSNGPHQNRNMSYAKLSRLVGFESNAISKFMTDHGDMAVSKWERLLDVLNLVIVPAEMLPTEPGKSPVYRKKNTVLNRTLSDQWEKGCKGEI